MSEEPTQQLLRDDLRRILERLDSIDMRLTSLDTGLTSLDTRLTSLESKVDRRLQETRPIWEGVLEQLKEVNGRLERVENESKDFRRMFRSAFSDLGRVQDDLEERVDKLEERIT